MHSPFAYALLLNLEREECEHNGFLVMICTYAKDKIPIYAITVLLLVGFL